MENIQITEDQRNRILDLTESIVTQNYTLLALNNAIDSILERNCTPNQDNPINGILYLTTVIQDTIDKSKENTDIILDILFGKDGTE